MISWIKGHISWLAVGILIILCMFLLYAWIDARVTVDHAWRVVDWERNDKKALRALLQETGKHMHRNELTRFVKEHFKGELDVIKEEGDQLSLNGIILKFDGEFLSKVMFINEENRR